MDYRLLQYTVLSIIALSSMLFYAIAPGNETGINSDVLGASLFLCGTIISSLNCYPRSPLTKTLFSFIIGFIFVCRDGHEKMMLYVAPSPRVRETFTACAFDTNGFLQLINVVTSTPPFLCSLYFPLSNPLKFDGSTSSRFFK